MRYLQLLGLLCAGIGALMAGQLFVDGPHGAAWYRFYIMVAGASLVVPGIMLALPTETALSQVIPGAIIAFLCGGTGITIGLIQHCKR
jgi:hypothetical protein